MALALRRFTVTVVPSRNATSIRVHPNSLAARRIVDRTSVPMKPAMRSEAIADVIVYPGLSGLVRFPGPAGREWTAHGARGVDEREVHERLWDVAEKRARPRI